MTLRPLPDFAQEYFERLKALVERLPSDRIERISEILLQAHRDKRQVFLIGNGGSAATASHMACDLGRNTVSRNGAGFRVVCLSDNTPLLSALANDLGYERIFVEQLVSILGPGDVLVAISTSGRSPNIVNAMHYAREHGATVVAFLGADGGDALDLSHEHVLVPAANRALVEDLHSVLHHVLSGYLKERIEAEAIST